MQQVMIETVDRNGKKLLLAKSHIIAIVEYAPGMCGVFMDSCNDFDEWTVRESAESLRVKYDN